jgi:hypothetical protein
LARINLEELSKSCHAVVVGVGTFETDGFQFLPAPEREAREISAALVDAKGCGIPPGQVCTLIGSAATSPGIRDALRRTATESSPGDTIVFYFSGHGYKSDQDFFLCPYDVKVADVLGSSVSGRELGELLSASCARGVLVILDCCVSAGFAEKAPDFFRRLGGTDFRILLSASREDQKSWETLDSKGTLFSTQLLALLNGKAPAGATPGHITFSGLLEAIDFGVKSDLAARPSVPIQDPVFVGVYSRDPLLFVHRASLLSGLTVDTARVTRAYLYRVIRKLLITLSATLIFAMGTYVAWLKAHEYAEAKGSNIVLYRGYPGLPWFRFPQLLREISYGPQEMATGSPIRNGGAIVAPMGKPVLPLVLNDLRPEYKALRAVSLGDIEQARRIALPILAVGPGTAGATSESLLIVSMVLPDIVQNEDLDMVRALFASDHQEVRTKALQVLLKLAPNEGLERASKDGLSRRDFEHLDILHDMTVACRPELTAYFSALLAARDALNIVGPVLDASMRLRCSVTADGLLAAARAVPRDKIWDVANYAQIQQVAGVEAALAAVPDPGDPLADARFAILRVGLDSAPCPPRKLSFPDQESTRVQQFELLLRACKKARAQFVSPSGNTPSQLVVTGPGAVEQRLDFDPAKLDFFTGDAWMHLFTYGGVTNSSDALVQTVKKSVDPNLQAKAVDELKTRKIPYMVVGSIPYGNSLTLRRALIAWQADTEPGDTAKYLMQHLSDQEMFDVQQLFGLATPNGDQVGVLKGLLNAGDADSRRATAILAMHDETGDVVDLLLSPRRDIAENAWAYVGNNPALEEISQALSHGDPLVAASVSRLAQSRAALVAELGNFPAELRRWRADFLLQNRRSALSTPGQLLTPGLVIWLRRTYGVTGDTGF